MSLNLTSPQKAKNRRSISSPKHVKPPQSVSKGRIRRPIARGAKNQLSESQDNQNQDSENELNEPENALFGYPKEEEQEYQLKTNKSHEENSDNDTPKSTSRSKKKANRRLIKKVRGRPRKRGHFHTFNNNNSDDDQPGISNSPHSPHSSYGLDEDFQSSFSKESSQPSKQKSSNLNSISMIDQNPPQSHEDFSSNSSKSPHNTDNEKISNNPLRSSHNNGNNSHIQIGKENHEREQSHNTRNERKEKISTPNPGQFHEEEAQESPSYEEIDEYNNNIYHKMPMPILSSGLDYTTYNISRTKKSMYLSQTFKLSCGEHVEMSAKCKGKRPTIVYINNNEDIHLSQKSGYLATMKISDDCQCYRLTTGVDETNVLTVNVRSLSHPITFNRVFLATIPNSAVKSLKSQVPKVLDGDVVGRLNFDGKFTVASVKNAILLDENDKKALMIRKISDNMIEIDNICNLDALVVFGFGILSWICPY